METDTFGSIDFSGISYNMDTDAEERGPRIAGESIWLEANTMVAYKPGDDQGWNGANGSIKVITNITDLGNGRLKWSWNTYEFVNGILITSL